MDLIETPKYNKKKCVEEFVHDLIQGNGVENFRKYSLNGELDKYHIRGMAWKIFMEVLPETETLEQWVETIDKLRKEYKTKTKSLLKAQKFKGDPLSGMAVTNTDSATWNTYYADNDTKKLINLDLDRTFQELSLFHQNKIKSNLADILFIWNKENLDVGYQQGMNDILAVTFLGLYPCYFKNVKKLGKNEILKISSEQISAIQNAEDIYDFFHDEDELYSDLYFCFSKLMKRGLKELFETFKGTEKHIIDYKKYQLFSNQLEEEPTDDMQNPLNIRCTLIIKEKLKSIDPELYQHFKKIGLNCGIFLQRWLKCMFDREFDLKDIFIIWDSIFATPDVQNGYGLVFLDYIAISMILRIRKKLLESDQNECFATLFKYPNIENISELVIFSNNLQIAVEEMIRGKRSIFLDNILGINTGNINLNNNSNNKNNSYNNIPSLQNNNNYGGNMSFFPQNFVAQNNEEIKENKGFFKNAMSSVGGFFSNFKQKIDKKFAQHNNNNNTGNNLGEINPIINMNNMNYMSNMNQISSNSECAQRIESLFNKYRNYFSNEDVNEYKAIVQYLNNSS
jgi:TBC1 domain family protein 5